MKEELPPSWTESTVGECFLEVRNGTTATQNAEGKGLPVSRIESIQDSCFDFERIRHVEKLPAEALENFRYRLGDIALSHINSYEHVGKTALYQGEPETFIHGMNLLRLRLGHDEIEPRFAHLFMQTNFFREEVRKRVGHAVNQVSINQKNLAKVPFIVAPIGEQRRIVAKLGTLLGKVDACQQRLAKIPLLLKRFRQSVLAAATSGQLTEDWGKSHNIPEWENARISDLCVSITDGDHQAPPQVSEGVPFITISAINDGKLRLEKATRSVPRHYYDRLKDSRKPRKGDVLYSVTGSIGVPALVDTDAPFTFQRHIAILKPDRSLVLSGYLLIALGADRTKEQALAIATGTAQLTIPLSGLREFIIPTPSLLEQQEIVRRVEALFALADKIEARYAKAKASVEKLTQSILGKAFSGKLVPQDPKEESATLLLERIRAAREAEAKKPKIKRMPKTKIVRRMLIDVFRSHKKPITPEQLFHEAGFRLSEVDSFYRELVSLRKTISEKKPSGARAKAWPYNARVLLELKTR